MSVSALARADAAVCRHQFLAIVVPPVAVQSIVEERIE
jgi:hypothetical protein